MIGKNFFVLLWKSIQLTTSNSKSYEQKVSMENLCNSYLYDNEKFVYYAIHFNAASYFK